MTESDTVFGIEDEVTYILEGDEFGITLQTDAEQITIDPRDAYQVADALRALATKMQVPEYAGYKLKLEASDD